MNDAIKQIIARHERIQNLYQIGPVHRAGVEEFIEDIVNECINNVNSYEAATIGDTLREHFGISSPLLPSMICPKCGIDRLRYVCLGDRVNCPMKGIAQDEN